jgi:anti-sigma28 factor (negative regulator of flagellin synthesis)
MKGKRSNSANDNAEAADGTQLSKLGSVLNGLEHGASRMRRKAQELMHSVRSGTYEIDPLQLSRRIIGDTLASL